MIFDEKEMLEVCQKYGIDVVEKKGYPLYDGIEMDENFSMNNIMHDTYSIGIDGKTIYSETLELEMPVIFEHIDIDNCFNSNNVGKPHFVLVENNEYNKNMKPSMVSDYNISFAA